MNTKKWTEGVLCFDPSGKYVVFWIDKNKKDMELKPNFVGVRIWCLKGRDCGTLGDKEGKMWHFDEFFRLYPESALPKKGGCVEIFLEL